MAMKENRSRLLLLALGIALALSLALLAGLALAKPPDPEAAQFIWTGWGWTEGNDPDEVFTFSFQHTPVGDRDGNDSTLSEFEVVGGGPSTHTFCFEGALEIYTPEHAPAYAEGENYFGFYFWLIDYTGESNQHYLEFDWADRHDEYWLIITKTSTTRWDYLIYNCADCTIDATGYITILNSTMGSPHGANATYEYYHPWCDVDSEVRIHTGDGEEWSDVSFTLTPQPIPDGWICDHVDDGDGALGCVSGDAPNMEVRHSFIPNTGCDGPGGNEECGVRKAGVTETEEEAKGAPLRGPTTQIHTADPANSPHPERLIMHKYRMENGLWAPPSQQTLLESIWVWIMKMWRRIFPRPEIQDTNQWWEARERFVPLNPSTPTPRPTLEP